MSYSMIEILQTVLKLITEIVKRNWNVISRGALRDSKNVEENGCFL